MSHPRSLITNENWYKSSGELVENIIASLPSLTERYAKRWEFALLSRERDGKVEQFLQMTPKSPTEEWIELRKQIPDEDVYFPDEDKLQNFINACMSELGELRAERCRIYELSQHKTFQPVLVRNQDQNSLEIHLIFPTIEGESVELSSNPFIPSAEAKLQFVIEGFFKNLATHSNWKPGFEQMANKFGMITPENVTEQIRKLLMDQFYFDLFSKNMLSLNTFAGATKEQCNILLHSEMREMIQHMIKNKIDIKTYSCSELLNLKNDIHELRDKGGNKLIEFFLMQKWLAREDLSIALATFRNEVEFRTQDITSLNKESFKKIFDILTKNDLYKKFDNATDVLLQFSLDKNANQRNNCIRLCNTSLAGGQDPEQVVKACLSRMDPAYSIFARAPDPANSNQASSRLSSNPREQKH